MLQNFFDNVFVITTVNSPRISYIKQHLNSHNINFEFIVAPDYKIISKDISVIHNTINNNSRASISLTSAYVSILHQSKLNNLNSIAIIEDDCFLTEDWKEKFLEFYTHIPTDWDVLNLGYHPIHDAEECKINLNKYVSIPTKNYYTTHFTAIKSSCFDSYVCLSEVFKYTFPADCVFIELYDKVKSFVPNEKFAYQLSLRENQQEFEIPNSPKTRFPSFI